MATIKKSKKDESQTILTVSGVLTREEIIHAYEDFVQHDVTPFLLWDFTDADLSNISKEDMEQIITVTKTYAHLRKNGKTALLVPTDLSFGISRMYEAFIEIREHPLTINAFRSREKALAWLVKSV